MNKAEKPEYKLWTLTRKSVGAALFIALGDFVLLKLGQPIGPFLFALGLLGVCYMKQNLFTGQCGFVLEDRIPALDLLIVLLVNLGAGWLFGFLFSAADTTVAEAAREKIATWGVTLPFFIRSCLCGVVMYVAVMLYRRGTPLGILFGIPLFIFCGFQHCIANVVTLGAARSFHWSLPVCAAGNFIGSLLTWVLTRERKEVKD